MFKCVIKIGASNLFPIHGYSNLNCESVYRCFYGFSFGVLAVIVVVVVAPFAVVRGDGGVASPVIED